MKNHLHHSDTSLKRDWQRWFRLGLIVFLLALSTISQAEVETPAPTEPGTDLTLELPPVEKLEVEELPAPEPFSAPLPPMPTMKTVPPGEPRHPAEIDAPAKQGELLPLPTTPKVGKSSESQIGSDSLPVKPEPAAQEPQDPAARWTMLITPGVSSQGGSAVAPQLVTFELNESTGAVQGEPQTRVLGFEAAAQQALELSAEKGSPEETLSLPPSPFPAPVRQHPLSKNYTQIYNSIPYSRAEYLANPAYRHETTIELMFGEMRPTTIQKNDTPRRIYNMPPLNETPALGAGPYVAPGAFSYGNGWSGGPWGYPGRTPYWGYWRAPTVYGPLFNYYYRPVGRPWGGI